VSADYVLTLLACLEGQKRTVDPADSTAWTSPRSRSSSTTAKAVPFWIVWFTRVPYLSRLARPIVKWRFSSFQEVPRFFVSCSCYYPHRPSLSPERGPSPWADSSGISLFNLNLPEAFHDPPLCSIELAFQKYHKVYRLLDNYEALNGE
jgi:hypothetical protein